MDTKVQAARLTTDRAGNEIIKYLERVTASGRRPSQIFEDWAELVEAALQMEPVHERSIRKTGKLADDPPDIQALWERMRARYGREHFEHFAHALQVLKTDAVVGYRDLIGEVYMAWGWPNTNVGQYFTPFDVALAMAQMTTDVDELHRRLKAAIAESPLATAALVAGTFLSGEQALAWYIARVIPAAVEHYEPITVHDPACGSGVMLLATAACYPPWAVRLGLVQFFGQDIDSLCVRMAKTNLMLYGMNGHGVESTIRRAEAVLARAPEHMPASPALTASEPEELLTTVSVEPIPATVETIPEVLEQLALL